MATVLAVAVAKQASCLRPALAGVAQAVRNANSRRCLHDTPKADQASPSKANLIENFAEIKEWKPRAQHSIRTTKTAIRKGANREPKPVAVVDQADDYLRRVLTARVYDVCIETPLQHAKGLSSQLNNNILLKREDLQPVFSFKLRGAYNKMVNLSPEQSQKGVVCCSAGNHAQGVAMSAARLGIDAVIVMPVPTPSIKVDGVRRHGGKVRVLLHGNNYDEAQAEAIRLMKEEGRTMIHPYDDPDVIAGQGTVGMEIIKQTMANPPHAIFACVGGGGLISGIAAYVKRIRPQVKIIGVEAEDAAAMTLSLAKGQRVMLDSVGLFADGAAVKQVGVENFRIASQYVDGMVTCSTDEICAAIRDGFNDTRTVMEPAGVLGVAGMKKYIQQTGASGQNFVAVTSGANMNFDRLRFVSERAVPNEVLISVKVPEIPGSFRRFYSVIHPRNITEFSYRYSNPKEALIMASFTVSSPNEVQQVVEHLQAQGMDALDLTGNELAKAHARYLAGGRSDAENEVMYRFEFPEMPGAIGRFLRNMGSTWNISLFHYRNHGADVGQVLVGMQVQPSDRPAFSKFLDELGYRYIDETHNPVYTAYLR
eukprot:comp22760_c1_seq1/m.35549 comp22760_c1_seq1/g.35549  ORF comp22760_c1_seq1/g.35549 comp22760_c1_seq1/m.35549 type:complete len:595 (-) comp22760_c1_seq1:553-2337(-)